ncbi:MAG TPA: FAD-dependent oxidoreductase [Ktedonobacterales bacterium]|nr:FAD-dependent oxidoreductase [Ktedonobacterales bacterium]
MTTDAIRLVIIGGSDAGISAALRAREINPRAEVTVVVADSYPNFSICGLPFYLSGETPDWHSLAHRTADEIERQGITLRLTTTARTIDPARRIVSVIDRAGVEADLPYDRLIIATGAEPAPSTIPGADLPGVYPLHTMDDSFAAHTSLTQRPPASAVIVGAGYIGLEMADALTHRGIAVTLTQRGPSVLSAVESELGQIIDDELQRHGVTVRTNAAIEAIAQDGERLVVADAQGFHASGDLVLLATGVRPVTELAASAGVALGARGAIRVSRAMETNVADVYAAGDCVETWHQLLQRPTYQPLGTTSHKQGRVAGENAVGGHRQFMGTLGTQVVKVFDLAVARTGLLTAEAQAAGYDALTVATSVWDHKAYYPGAQRLHIRVTGDRASGRLLGAQIVGHWRAEVAKRIDVFATALAHEMTVDGLSDLDLSYTPPLSSPWDPVQMAAQAWASAI